MVFQLAHLYTLQSTYTHAGTHARNKVRAHIPWFSFQLPLCHAHVHTYTSMPIHVHTYTSMPVQVHTYTSMPIRVHTHTHPCLYVHTHTHTSMPMHVHTTVRAHDAWPSSHVPLSNIHMHTCIHTHTAPSPQTPKCTCTYHSARPRCLALLPAAPIKKAALPAAFPTLRGCRCTWHVMMQPGVPMLCAAAPQHSHRT